jgi:hypothetical protein
MGAGQVSPFGALEEEFWRVAAQSAPPAIDGRVVGGLPNRLVAVGELRTRLLDPEVAYRTRDRALAALLRRARDDGGVWMVGLAGVLLPGLRAAVAPLVKALPGRADDLEAETLVGLVAAVEAMPVRADRVAARLVWAAVRAAYRFAEAERAWRDREDPHPELPAAWSAPNHPDLVLEEAVRAGVVSARDAELVGETRIGGVALRELARAWGVSYEALCKRRERCEPALVAWLVSRQLSANRP